MPAPKGHPRWGNPLKPKKYSPERLWEGAKEYFEWCDNNPIMVAEQSKLPQRLTAAMTATMKPAMIKKFLTQLIDIPYKRPYTIEGMCLHLNISRETFDNYSNIEGYETYFDICRAIRRIIDTQHFEGGMVGQFNANIVTRKLGLAEKHSSEINLNIPKVEVDNEETGKAIKGLFE